MMFGDDCHGQLRRPWATAVTQSFAWEAPAVEEEEPAEEEESTEERRPLKKRANPSQPASTWVKLCREGVFGDEASLSLFLAHDSLYLKVA